MQALYYFKREVHSQKCYIPDPSLEAIGKSKSSFKKLDLVKYPAIRIITS